MKVVKILKEKYRTSLFFFSLGIGKNFLDRTPKIQVTLETIDKLDFINIKMFCAPKEIIKQIEIQFTEWRKY